jgi:hypothetical protein
MYQYSRAIFLALKDLVDPAPDRLSPAEARRQVLLASERTIERLAQDPRYFARPARSLFEEIRHLFPIRRQEQAFVAIESVVSVAVERIAQELERASLSEGRCRATTRKGRPCQRTPLPGSRFCPSHQHLAERPVPLAVA